MVDVVSSAPIEIVQLQMDEIVQQGIDLDDAAFAYELQLQEACRASAQAAEIDCTTLSESSYPEEALVNNQLQAAALRETAVSLNDAKQAQKLQRELQQRAALEVHDLHVAHWLDEVNDSDWDSHGDNLELPINPSSLQNNKLHAFLHFGGHVQGHRIGYAASLQHASGVLIWQSSEAENVNGHVNKVAAQLKALHMGLLAAQQLGFENVRIQAPNSHQLLQVLENGMCSSMLAPYVDAVQEAIHSFESAPIVIGDSQQTWHMYQSAAQVCKKRHRGGNQGRSYAARSIGRTDSKAGSVADLTDLAEEAEVPTEACTICLEDVPQSQIQVIAGCLHRFCITCLQTHSHNKVKDRQFPVPCPHPNCPTTLSHEECDILLTSSQARQLLADLATEASIPEASKFYCPYPECSALMVAEERGPNQQAECLACHRWLCLWCRTPWHHNQSCGQAKASATDDGPLLQLARQCRWRQCQRCKHMIELSHGCNHMTCRCGADFCYQCGVEYQQGAAQCRCDLWDETLLLAAEQRQRQQAVGNNEQPVHNGNPYYRTQMCRHFMRGNCWRGEDCQFAHAWEDIRAGPAHAGPQY